MNLKEARTREAEIVGELKGLFADFSKSGRSAFTDVEAERDDKLNADLGEIRETLRRLERANEAERALAEVKDAGVAAVEAATQAAAGAPARNPLKLFNSFGDQMMAIAHSARPGATVDRRLMEIMGAASGMSEGVPSDGGFLLQPDYSAGLLTVMHDIGSVYARVRKLPISPNATSIRINAVDEKSRVDGSRWGGVQGYWTPEAGEKLASQVKFRQMEMNLKKLTCLCYVTDELLSDAVALGAVLGQAFPEELNFRTEDAIINGSGGPMPQGLLNSAAKITVAAEGGQAANTIVYENILKMWNRMYAGGRSNAVWLINQNIAPQLYTLSMKIGTGGAPVFLPPTGATGGQYSTLFNRPIIPVEYCQTLGTEGDIILADLSQYMMIERGGIQSASSIHVRFVYDETCFRFVYRCDGQPSWNVARTPFKGSTTVSPFITLATRP